MSRDTIRLPHDAYRLLQTLRAAGHSAYVVGGCVRDSLLGRLPGDWDICTSARPDEMKALFCSQRLILTGEKHGTVAVILHGKPYEMTTYRLDGSYRDHRHPDNVQFVDDLAADLARRDFTINAMAYAPGEGVIDLYGGRSDLAARVVRCVGTPADRFAEDALRILRALRFASSTGFGRRAVMAQHTKPKQQVLVACLNRFERRITPSLSWFRVELDSQAHKLVVFLFYPCHAFDAAQIYSHLVRNHR